MKIVEILEKCGVLISRALQNFSTLEFQLDLKIISNEYQQPPQKKNSTYFNKTLFSNLCQLRLICKDSSNIQTIFDLQNLHLYLVRYKTMTGKRN